MPVLCGGVLYKVEISAIATESMLVFSYLYPLSKPLSRLPYLETVEKLLLRMLGGVPVGGKAALLLSIMVDKIKVENEIIQRRIPLAKKKKKNPKTMCLVGTVEFG